jgi:ATP-dependent protease ClpP protease subunit
MKRRYWGEKRQKISLSAKDSDSDDNTSIINLPSLFPKNVNNYIYSNFAHIYFNNDINPDTAFELNKELRQVENKINMLSISLGIDKQPIYLHLTTDGGVIYSAMSIIDCIKSLSVPVYTVIDGFVASAGTLIALAGEKRYMCENAYMLIHELRSGFWGKMTDISEEYCNLKRLMKHIIKLYVNTTNLTKSELTEILKKDVNWNLNDCIAKGLVHEKYK